MQEPCGKVPSYALLIARACTHYEIERILLAPTTLQPWLHSVTSYFYNKRKENSHACLLMSVEHPAEPPCIVCATMGFPAPCRCGYRILKSLGNGCAATVLKCERVSDGLVVAVKLNDLAKVVSQSEAACLDACNHPNVLKKLRCETNAAHSRQLLEVEYCEDGDLYHLIHRRRKLLSEEEVLSILAQLLLALEHIHSAHILHRDVKSSNVFISGPLVKLGRLWLV